MVYHRPVEKYHTLNALLLGPPIESRLPEASDLALAGLVRFCREMIADNPEGAKYFGHILEATESEQGKRLLPAESSPLAKSMERLAKEMRDLDSILRELPEASDFARVIAEAAEAAEARRP